MEDWKTLTRRILVKNRWLTVESHSIEIPDGRVLDDWLWVIVPDYVNVMAVTEDGKFLVFRQQKYAADGLTLALTGGIVEIGESPIEAARRELLEEMGYESDEWIFLGDYATDANRGVGRGHIFLALDARRSEKIHSDDLEDQELMMLTEEELHVALLAGEFQIISWVAAIGLALIYLDKR